MVCTLNSKSTKQLSSSLKKVRGPEKGYTHTNTRTHALFHALLSHWYLLRAQREREREGKREREGVNTRPWCLFFRSACLLLSLTKELVVTLSLSLSLSLSPSLCKQLSGFISYFCNVMLHYFCRPTFVEPYVCLIKLIYVTADV